jgi:hypothetical protein
LPFGKPAPVHRVSTVVSSTIKLLSETQAEIERLLNLFRGGGVSDAPEVDAGVKKLIDKLNETSSNNP